ncbi:hypothetical protein GQ457_11G026680 [Hibiscus cannabinus]
MLLGTLFFSPLSRGRGCLCTPFASFVTTIGTWLWPLWELGLPLQHSRALHSPRLDVGLSRALRPPRLSVGLAAVLALLFVLAVLFDWQFVAVLAVGASWILSCFASFSLTWCTSVELVLWTSRLRAIMHLFVCCTYGVALLIRPSQRASCGKELAAVTDACFEQSPKTATVGSHPRCIGPLSGCLSAVSAAWFMLPPQATLAATVGSDPRGLLVSTSPCLRLVSWLLDSLLCDVGFVARLRVRFATCLAEWMPLEQFGSMARPPAFVQWRAITDNILVAHEIVHTLHTSVSWSSQGVVFKLDMEKAFDRVEWPFLKAVMLCLGFAPSWVDLIMRCVSSVSSRVRVRGALSEAFLPQRGLRQGDPLSPFLFLCCTEGLSAALTAAQHEGCLPGVRASNPRTPSAHRIAIHEALGVHKGVDDPGIYLGVTLLIGKNKYAAFGRYRDKVDTRVSKWSNLLLSYSGRELSGKGSARGWALVAWDDICLPKTAGGIGFKDLHLFNFALLGSSFGVCSRRQVLFFIVRYAPNISLMETCSARRPLRAPLLLGKAFIVRWCVSGKGSFGLWALTAKFACFSPITLVWGDHDSSLFIVRSGYLFLRRPPSPISPPLRLWKILAKHPTIPKVRSFARSLYFSPSSGAFGGVVTLGCMSAPSILCILLSRTLFRFVMTMHRRSVKINVDGAFLLSASVSAIGVNARDSSGAVLGGFAKPVPVHGPASTVEVSALFVGLEFVIDNDWPSALIESDVAVLVNKLHRPSVDLSLLGDLLAPSRALLAASNGRLRVGFASRSANTDAHALASCAYHNDNVISFSSVCPELNSRIVLDDLSSSF